MLTKLVAGFPLPFLFLLMFMRCMILEDKDPEKYIITSGDYSYDLNNPTEEHILPNILQEISGLAYWKKGILLCVEDETGHLYLYDHVKKEIINTIKFWKKGDFEGVTVSNDTAYVIKSNGHLYYFKIKDEPEVTNRSLPFTEKNDLEGIAKGHSNSTFYIVCKRSPDLFDIDLKGKAVYKYNLKNDTVYREPFIHLTTDMFKMMLKDADLTPSNHMPFQPSGIAVHPLTEDVFLLSSVGKLLIVFNRSGKLVSMAPLKRSIFRQPEGICFDEKGNLFIANEGRGWKGYILKFEIAAGNQ
jgi:uncharacterized protein YjiK